MHNEDQYIFDSDCKFRIDKTYALKLNVIITQYINKNIIDKLLRNHVSTFTQKNSKLNVVYTVKIVIKRFFRTATIICIFNIVSTIT